MNNYQVDRAKWASMDIFNQMGNIGSEVGRAIMAKRQGDEQRTNSAIKRALDLFDATTEDLVQKKSPRVKEVLRAKDQFLSLFFDDNFSDADDIERYFMQYAIAARR
jgi:hypothetical protein